MPRLITVLDLGSSKIAAATARVTRDGGVSLLGLENLYSRGIEKGDITDINKVIEDISSLTKKLRRSHRQKMKSVFVAIKGADIKMELSRGMIPLASTPREITKRDVRRCLEIGAMVRLSLDGTVVDKIIKGFYIDGSPLSVINPVGLYGVKLEAEAFIATARLSKIQNIAKCMDHTGLFLDGICISGVASSNSVLDEKERGEGVLLLDIGDTLTEGLVFKNHLLKAFRIIEKGASNVLNDNMRPDRKRLKALLEEGRALLSPDSKNFLSVVVTGGGALLDGAVEATEKIFKMPARIGIVRNAGRNLNSQDAIIHASTIGLIDHLAKEYKINHTYKGPVHKAFKKIFDIYESYF